MGFDSGVNAHANAILCHVYLGHPDRALVVSEAAVALAKRVEHPFSLGIALFCGGVVHIQRGELDRAREHAEEVVVLAERLGFPFWLGVGRVVRGWARVESGEGAAGIAKMQQALVELARIGNGLALGVAQAEQQGQHYYDAELHRLRAEILIADCGMRNAE